jgi:MarR family multiple antibiotic resistance transcriptional regulator
MIEDTLDDSGLGLFDALVRYETDLWNAVDRDLAAAELPGLGHVQALRIVAAKAGSCRVHELREGLGITGGAASKVTDRLEAAGLVVRAANPDDRRSSFIVLTPTGGSTLERATRVFTASLARYLAGAADETGRLTAALGDLHSLLRNRQTGDL